MKLKMSLPTRPGLIYLTPSLDILALVLVFPIFISAFSSNSGIELTTPDSMHRFSKLTHPIVVSITGGKNPKIWVYKRQVSEFELRDVLAEEAEKYHGGGAVSVVFKVDFSVPSGLKARVSEILLSGGYRVYDARNPTLK